MDIYRQAMLTQGACNLGGLVRGWAETIVQLQQIARAEGKGTDWINTHPVNVLFAEQVYFLTGSGKDYAAAYRACAGDK